MSNIWSDFGAPIGALLVALGAIVQLSLDLGDVQGYMRSAKALDETGVTAARERAFFMGYKFPEKLTWMPRETGQWIASKSPHMFGWICVCLGSFIVFAATLVPLLGSGAWLALVSIGAFVVIVIVSGVVTAGRQQEGRIRAEMDWRAEHPDDQVKKDLDSVVEGWLVRFWSFLFSS